jgi:DNA-binding transcriptional LysR family regulator
MKSFSPRTDDFNDPTESMDPIDHGFMCSQSFYDLNALALRECAVAGMGLVLLPRWVVARELDSGALVDLFPDHQVTATDFDSAAWLLYPSRAYLPLKVRVFVDFLKEKLRNGVPREAPSRKNARR